MSGHSVLVVLAECYATLRVFTGKKSKKNSPKQFSKKIPKKIPKKKFQKKVPKKKIPKKNSENQKTVLHKLLRMS
jgi:hypothetical protein